MFFLFCFFNVFCHNTTYLSFIFIEEVQCSEKALTLTPRLRGVQWELWPRQQRGSAERTNHWDRLNAPRGASSTSWTTEVAPQAEEQMELTAVIRRFARQKDSWIQKHHHEGLCFCLFTLP